MNLAICKTAALIVYGGPGVSGLLAPKHADGE